METTGNYWTLGELVTLPRMEKLLKKSGSKSYSHYIGSHYICIREATSGQRGILMKVLGKSYRDRIMMVNGEPFSKDDHEELFTGDHYFSYSFPRDNEVMEALDIIRGNQDLRQKFEEASMHLNPNSTFWVSDITRDMLLRRKPQFLDGRDGQLYPARDDSEHYRVTFVYFYKGSLNW
ncbi:MAG: hypothetical protein II886_09185 [Prevotella sp.]|nr:hypothetical protein [Prevotella sp.]